MTDAAPSPKRYSLFWDDLMEVAREDEHAEGEYVAWADFAALTAEAAGLRGEVAELRAIARLADKVMKAAHDTTPIEVVIRDKSNLRAVLDALRSSKGAA